MWTLVYIFFIAGDLGTVEIGNYEDMYDCFDAREILSIDVGSEDGYFPANSQAVCVYRDDMQTL